MLRVNRLFRSIVGCMVVLFFVTQTSGFLKIGIQDVVDRYLYDIRLKNEKGQGKPDDRITIVDIDEKSLAKEGRWPWPRAKIAMLLDRLDELGPPAVVAFDVVFAEPQLGGDDDYKLAKAMHKQPVVLGYYLTSDRNGLRVGALPDPVFEGEAAKSIKPFVFRSNGYAGNIPILMDAAQSAGFFNTFFGGDWDTDGVVRALPLMGELDGKIYESLDLATLREYLNAHNLIFDKDFRLFLKGERREVSIPISAGFTAMVPMVGSGGPAGGQFVYLSATDVLHQKLNRSLLKDRIVLIGTTAPGQSDLRSTPTNEVFPGVEIHAALMKGALDHKIPLRLRETGFLMSMILLIVGGLLAVSLPAMNIWSAIFTTVGVLLLILLGKQMAFDKIGLILPVSAPLIGITALGLLDIALGRLAEAQSRRAVSKLFGEYVSPALVKEMMQHDPDQWESLISSNRELTILFVDIRGFTRMAEKMDPSELKEYLNLFLTRMTEVVHAHHGILDKYIGDALMAFWGAPMDDPDHADRAVSAALDMSVEAGRLSDQYIASGFPALRIGVGVNTGVVCVGDLGSHLRRAYTVIGDPVNLASRIESLTKHYMVPVLVSESTVRQCKRNQFISLGEAEVQGREEKVSLYAPVPQE